MPLPRTIGTSRALLAKRGGTTYYVDASSGSDSNTGLTTSAPWQTMTKVNAAALARGDSVLFKRGETWTGTALTARTDVTYADYGSGALPIIDGNNAVDVVSLSSLSGVVLRNLSIKNGLDFGITLSGCANCTIIDCTVDHCGNDNILFIDGCRNCQVAGGSSTGAYQRVADGRTVTCLEIADDADGITVSGMTLSGSAAVGLSIHAHTGEGFPKNITIANCAISGCGTQGIQVYNFGGTVPSVRNIALQGCSITTCATGLLIGKDAGATDYPSGVTVRTLRSYANTNEAGLITGDNLLFTNCLFAKGRSLSVASCQNATFYNCTVYNDVAAIAALRISGARSQNLVMRNVIIWNVVAGQVIVDVNATTGTTGWDVNYNLWFRTGGTAASTQWGWKGTGYTFANWKIQSGGDANSIGGSNPLLVDPANNDYTLQAGSPALNAGVNVGYGANIGAY